MNMADPSPEQQTLTIQQTIDLALQHHRASRLPEAESIYQQILQSDPNQPVALHLLGVIAHQVDKNDIAVDLITKALAIKPDLAEAHNNLGIVLKDLGKLEDAVASYHKALAIKPDYAEAHNNLGLALRDLGKLEDAVTSHRKALDIKPDFAEAHYNLGNALQKRRRLEDAVTSYREALAIKPDYSKVHNNLGNALQDLGKLDEAVASYHKALTIKPNYAEAHNNLGNALMELGQLEDAVANHHKALAIKPDYADAHNNLGNALMELGRLEEAVASVRKALAIKPDLAEAHANLAEVLERSNRTEDLREAVVVAKRNCPGHPRLSLGEAYLLKREGDFVAARAVLESAGDWEADARFLSARACLLGNLYDRLGGGEAAYNYFRECNRWSKDTPKAKRAYEKDYSAQIDVLAKRFTTKWIAGWQQFEINSKRSDPVFLVGFPRSGTTLLDTILRSHTAISVIEEKPTVEIVQYALERLPGGYPDGMAKLDPAQMAELRRIYFAELDKHLKPEERSAVVVDKLPLNTVHAGLIHRVFPKARFVFAQRHPCDCVLSCFMQNFKVNDAMVNFLNLEDAARLYDKVMALWQQYQAVLPLAVHTVRYEGLIEDFEETVSPVLDFLGVEWDDCLRNYADTAYRRGKINTPSYNQVTQPLYTHARGRWERYREQMKHVFPTLLPWARRFGYGE
jgi:Flp pilus assembly protein TadD